MRRAKRWLLVFAALLGLMSHAGALRATSLFGKSSTSTTTTTTTTTSTEVPETTAVTEEATETKALTNATGKPVKKLTGIPQIDWVWDPNLPRELNGYNLSSYPFFSTVPPPDEIAFKCNGLHDGFYASIEYKCQVYHHCIYGIRHDFLCANFTAFDQRTFICHFVSEVDCKNSEKFWNRNDNLYMATTTTSTTTTTTPAPITPEPEYRPRPNRRPLRRRRPSDYYYDEDYEDDYYLDERRTNRRRKQRPRNRRPADYDEDYEERRSYSDEDTRFEKRPKTSSRDRTRDDTDEDYTDERRIRQRQRPKTGAVGRQGDVTERRKLSGARKSMADRQATLDERRSLSDERDKPRNRLDDAVAEVPERRPIAGGRRRHNGERRPAPLDDDYDRPNRRTEVEDEKPIEPRPEKELVRPSTSASGGSPVASIFERPRVPPKIARPVPISEKRKYGYQGQKTTTSTSTASPVSDEYYDDEEYDDVPAKDALAPLDPIDSKDPPPRRRVQDELNAQRADDIPLRRPHSQSRRGSDDVLRRPGRPIQRKPLEPIRRPIDDYDSKDDSEERIPPRKRPLPISDDTEEDIEPLKEDTRDYRPRAREPLRRPLKKEDPIEETVRDNRRDHRRRPTESDRAIVTPPPPAPEEESEETYDDKIDDSVDPLPAENLPSSPDNDKPAQREGRPVVRVVKRPFLPSRGGSPYLPRGLQPVGAALRQTTTESTPIDMGSTISGVRLLEHGAPILRENADTSAPADYTAITRKGPRTTLPPQVEYPKTSLDELYENDYDVTLNDALNPTLKPLSSSNRNYLGPFNKYERGGYSAPSSNYNNGGDSYYSSTDVRRRTIPAQRNTRQEFRGATRIAQHFYDDFEY